LKRVRRVIFLGMDGWEPSIVEPMLAAGALPNLARLRQCGGYARLATTMPAQTPVAWSSFAVGANPGVHGIYDFLRRDPSTYLPDMGLYRYEQKSAFLPPRAVNLRGGEAIWDVLSRAGIPSTVLRHPCTYPPDSPRGRMLAGVGVPDLRGGFGTSTYYTAADDRRVGESERVIPIENGAGPVETVLIGPYNPKASRDSSIDVRLEVDVAAGLVRIHSRGEPSVLEVRCGEWSGWLRVKFKLGAVQAVRGQLRFHLLDVAPLRLYASPVNFDPQAPVFPISHPWDYAGELERHLGAYHTLGMAEDHNGLNNGRLDEAAFLAQCDTVVRERRAMMLRELERLDDGFFYCLYDTPDRLQHMLWRFRDPTHPANAANPTPAGFEDAIEQSYRGFDGIIGEALELADAETLFMVASDHGFTGFRRDVHLNTWLHRQGWLALKPDIEPGADAGDMLHGVDWSGTRAYALGLAGIYLNLRGREAEGIVDAQDAASVAAQIAASLTGLEDAATGDVAVRAVVAREKVYRGPRLQDAPDLLVCCAPGWRTSAATALGGVPAEVFADNVKRWSGDHVVDPAAVPGVLFMNRPFRGRAARLIDLAPTILGALGVAPGEAMEGGTLLE
jgi:predicted AlkP superfamily phosphohydrolase/phosphomutase